MTWVGYIALSTITYSAAILLQRVLVEENKDHPIAFIVLYQALVGIMVLGFGWLRGSLSLPHEVFGTLWLPVILSFLLYAGANYCIFAALERIQASKFTIVFASRMFFTAVAARLLLGESLNLSQYGGALLIFVGIVVANYSTQSANQSQKGLLWALGGALCFGLANVNDRYILSSMELYTYTGLSFFGTAIVLAVLQTKRLLSGVILLQPRPLSRIALLSIFYGISAVTFFGALQIGESASQVVSVSLVSVIVTVLSAMVFLKERDYPYQKLLGAVLASIGVLLLV